MSADLLRCLFWHAQAEELAQIEAMKMEELRKLQRDRRVLDQQSRALLKLPTKRDKEEIQALEVRAMPTTMSRSVNELLCLLMQGCPSSKCHGS